MDRVNGWTAVSDSRFGCFVIEGGEIWRGGVGHPLTLGFDPGAQTGWALLRGKANPLFLAGGVIDVREEALPFHALKASVEELASATSSDGAHIVIEQGFHAATASQTFAKELRGALKAGTEAVGVRALEINPMTVRACLGRQRMTDAQRREVVCSYFGLPEKLRVDGKGRPLALPSHLIDAALVAWAATLS